MGLILWSKDYLLSLYFSIGHLELDGYEHGLMVRVPLLN